MFGSESTVSEAVFIFTASDGNTKTINFSGAVTLAALMDFLSADAATIRLEATLNTAAGKFSTSMGFPSSTSLVGALPPKP
jgi:hypothetical protein